MNLKKGKLLQSKQKQRYNESKNNTVYASGKQCEADKNARQRMRKRNK